MKSYIRNKLMALGKNIGNMKKRRMLRLKL
nr:MAG TPA: hypothetical protein [Caudoviricetes sp.]